MSLHRFSWFALAAIVACSSQGSSVDDTRGDLNDRAGEDAGGTDAGGETDSATPDAGTDADVAAPDAGTDAGPSARLTPSNLPPGICDSAGTTDLSVPAGTDLTIDPNETCDALIPQSDGLPPICVHTYANVTIGGSLLLKAHVGAPRPPAMAIVATQAFTLESGAIVDASGDYLESPPLGREGPGASDPRGQPPANSGQGAGHVTPGAGIGEGSVGGNAFGPTTGTQLVAGSTGSVGPIGPPPYDSGGQAGRAGGAVQLVSCGRLTLSGTVKASGNRGFEGRTSVTFPTGGGGGGSGGTVLIEAATIGGSGGSLLAAGGQGGPGGDFYQRPLSDHRGLLSDGPFCVGGAGGTGTTPPQPGGETSPRSCAPGGGGGAVGRILINVPQGVSLPAIAADPPAAIGVLGTH